MAIVLCQTCCQCLHTSLFLLAQSLSILEKCSHCLQAPFVYLHIACLSQTFCQYIQDLPMQSLYIPDKWPMFSGLLSLPAHSVPDMFSMSQGFLAQGCLCTSLSLSEYSLHQTCTRISCVHQHIVSLYQALWPMSVGLFLWFLHTVCALQLSMSPGFLVSTCIKAVLWVETVCEL